MSSGPTPADSNAALAANSVADGEPSTARDGLNTSNVPYLRVRNSTARSQTGSSRNSLAFAGDASTSDAAPSLGLQNMYLVSGSLTMSASAISSTLNACRRQALGLRAPLRNALADSSASSRGSRSYWSR